MRLVSAQADIVVFKFTAAWQARVDSRGGARLCGQAGLIEGIFNHFTLAVPGPMTDSANPFGLHWSEVTASCLDGSRLRWQPFERAGDIERSAFCNPRADPPDDPECGLRAAHPHAVRPAL